MAKRKIAIVEQETQGPEETAIPEQRKRRAARQQANHSVAASSVGGKIVPMPARSARPAPAPERAPTVGDLAMLYPSIATFPGLAMSTVAPSTHTSRSPQRRLSVRQCLSELREAVAEGWEIVQPIFARPLWSVTDDSTTAFNFVLRRDVSTRLVVVPEGRTVERFIRERNLIVDYRR